MPIYHCAENQHNKVWEYRVKGLVVEVLWGRVGLELSSQIKEFPSPSARDKFIAQKVSEKIKKGYKEVTQNEIRQETQTALAIGTQNKISKIVWVNKSGNNLSVIDNYDPSKWVYVEIMNSWSKEVFRYLLNKTESFSIPGNVTEFDRKIMVGEIYRDSSSLVSAIRDVLRRTAQKVVEAIKVVKMAAMGVRSFGDDDSGPSIDMSAILKSVSDNSVSDQVVMKFAALGSRALEL